MRTLAQATAATIRRSATWKFVATEPTDRGGEVAAIRAYCGDLGGQAGERDLDLDSR